MTRAEEFEQLRPLLFAIAYGIPGSVSEVEDAGPGDLAEERSAVRLERRDPLGGDQLVGGVVLAGRVGRQRIARRAARAVASLTRLPSS